MTDITAANGYIIVRLITLNTPHPALCLVQGEADGVGYFVPLHGLIQMTSEKPALYATHKQQVVATCVVEPREVPSDLGETIDLTDVG